MRTWVEITNPTHGGAGWEFGTCLWSPQVNKGGVRSWELMTEIRPGDLVFHLLKEGAGAGYFLVGASVASAGAQDITVEPPEPDRWGGMSPYYRVPVERFMRINTPISIDQFLASNRNVLEEELRRNPKGQFFEKKASGRLQVSLKYLARADDRVEDLLKVAFSSQRSLPDQLEGESFAPTEVAPAYPDYTPPGSIEARITRKIRDTRLSREAKERFDFRCAICGYRIPLSRGKFYVEAHHLKPLGAGHNGPDTEDNLLVLCPTHHAEFDYGALAVAPIRQVIESVDSTHSHHGRAPTYSLAHLNPEFVTYHYKLIFRASK